jgi:5-methylcytosine-specific restriction endonuclease McrA
MAAMLDHHIDGSYLCSKRCAKLRFRQGILDSWGCACAYCGSPAGTLDHVKAKRRGGSSVQHNLVAACAGCNRAKGSAEWMSWFRAQDFWEASREERLLDWLGMGAARIELA